MLKPLALLKQPALTYRIGIMFKNPGLGKPEFSYRLITPKAMGVNLIAHNRRAQSNAEKRKPKIKLNCYSKLQNGDISIKNN